jgi:hypothetical protein
MPCYLESSKGMPNLAIYEKLGFQGVGEIECVDGKDICTVCFLPSSLFLSSSLLVRKSSSGYANCAAILYDPPAGYEYE